MIAREAILVAAAMGLYLLALVAYLAHLATRLGPVGLLAARRGLARPGGACNTSSRARP